MRRGPYRLHGRASSVPGGVHLPTALLNADTLTVYDQCVLTRDAAKLIVSSLPRRRPSIAVEHEHDGQMIGAAAPVCRGHLQLKTTIESTHVNIPRAHVATATPSISTLRLIIRTAVVVAGALVVAPAALGP